MESTQRLRTIHSLAREVNTTPRHMAALLKQAGVTPTLTVDAREYFSETDVRPVVGESRSVKQGDGG